LDSNLPPGAYDPLAEKLIAGCCSKRSQRRATVFKVKWSEE
jgi:hypothetical protein